MLSIANLNVNINKTPVLRDVSLNMDKGSTVGLIGRNGAGKTTLIRAIMGGLIKTESGKVLINGKEMESVPAHERVLSQVGYMPEDRRLIPELSVEENVLLPLWAVNDKQADSRLAWVYDLMPEVATFSTRKALQLSGGQQKLVALARSLMVGEKLLLLDEPFEGGVAPALSQRLVEVLHRLKAEGLSVMLSESDYTHSAGLVDKVYIIERGEITKSTKINEADYKR